MTPAEADSFADKTAIYIHIPFCRSICPYCDFAVVAGREDAIDRYMKALIEEITAVPGGRLIEAIYFGGGTPSHVGPEVLAPVIDAIGATHRLDDDVEVSLEVNPEDIGPGNADELSAIGFNRISFGAQSFDAGVLKALGRNHTGAQVARAVAATRAAGFANISLDLILGQPDEDAASWAETLARAIDLSPDHLSAYALTVEPGTPLWRSIRDGAPAPDEESQADRYEHTARAAELAGLTRYEVSNWATDGSQCRYNLTVWAQGEYLGHGNGAHGFRTGVRYRNHRGLDAYLRRVESGGSAVAAEEAMDDWELEVDRVFVGLRRRVGVTRGPATEALLGSLDGQRLVDNGVVEVDGNRLKVNNPLLTDAVQRCLMEATRR